MATYKGAMNEDKYWKNFFGFNKALFQTDWNKHAYHVKHIYNTPAGTIETCAKIEHENEGKQEAHVCSRMSGKISDFGGL